MTGPASSDRDGWASRIPPERTVIAGQAWRVSRAWPGEGGGMTVELRREGGGSGVRAGRWSAAGGFRLAAEGRDEHLPGLAGWAVRGTVVSHRLGRRAVVHSGDGFVKIVRPRRVQAVVAAADAATVFSPAFRCARHRREPDAEREGAVVWEALPGRTLHEAGSDRGLPVRDWDRAWERWAVAWRSVIAADPRGLPVHGIREEAAVLRRWTEAAATVVPGLAAGDAADRCVAALRDAGEGPAVPAHRDLHDKQILIDDDGGLSLLDVDTVCAADAALDLGNLRAHADLRARQGVWSPRRASIARRWIDDVAAVTVPAERLAAAEAASRLRLACVYLFRPRWHALARDLMWSLLYTQ
ncbi:phosphotransferase family protein [Microbacterium sp.]|uniref:phosphotransferase family protein n=1 Tax=Microbacterium sp. TaxID=51671 RepID=UPI003A853144